MKEANVWVRYKKQYKSTANSEHNKPLYKNELEQKSPQSSQIKRLSVILLIFGQYDPFNFCPRSVMLFVIPALGSGLPWQQLEQLIQDSLAELPDVNWQLYPPQQAPAADAMPNNTQRPKMTIGRAAVIGLIARYVSTGFDYRLSLLEVQKLVYFLTAIGEPLNKVVFQKHHFGPYADVLRHVLDKTEGHFIRGYADGLNKPETPIELKKDATQEALSYLNEHKATKQRLDKVAKLIEGFESQNGMELLSTVHWVATQEPEHEMLTSERIIEKVHSWNHRKAQMKPAHILAAWNRLKEQNWLENKAPVV